MVHCFGVPAKADGFCMRLSYSMGRGNVLRGRVHYQPWLDERPGDVPLERLWDWVVGK